jgi:hypothetical protein
MSPLPGALDFKCNLGASCETAQLKTTNNAIRKASTYSHIALVAAGLTGGNFLSPVTHTP